MMRRLLMAVLVVVAALAAAGQARAAGIPTLTEAQGAQFPTRTWVLNLPAQRAVGAADLDVRENGRPVSGVRVAAGSAAGSNAFGVVLAIDASNSMHGAAIEGAMAAARAFAAHRAPSQQLGLLIFNHSHEVLLPLTTDGAKIDAALSSTPALARGTRIYDAGDAAIGMLHDAGIRAGSVVILSDGADVGSETSPNAFAAQARRSHVRVFTVGLRSASFNSSTLSSMAASAGGAYSEAGSQRDLKRIYGALGSQLARDYLITYQSLAPAGKTVNVSVDVHGVNGTAVASYAAPSLQGALKHTQATSSWWSSTSALLVAALVVAALLGGSLLLVVRGPQQTVTDRITAYTSDQSLLTATPALPETPSVIEALSERLLRRARWWPRFVERVDIAGAGLNAVQLAVVTVIATIIFSWAAVASGRPLAAVILLFLPVFVHVWLRVRVERTQRAFADQLAETLEIVASAMRAGHSFEGGLAVASEDAAEPMKSNLRRVVNDERLGVPLQETMGAVAIRMDCPEFEQIAMIVALQRQSGGNTAELLNRTSETLRHRADLRRLVRQLTAQGRAGGIIVSAIPICLALLMSLISPGYLSPMLDHTAGVIALVLAGAMVATGWLVINKIVDIKV